MLVSFNLPALLIAILILALGLGFIWLKTKNAYHVFFCLVFGIYLIGVVSVVVFPFPVGYNLSDFKPNINIIPLNMGLCDFESLCLQQIYQNILLTIPFGFGVNFIARVKSKSVFLLALAVGFTFEFVQLVISLVVRSPFRAVDINDLFLNATGVLLGYGVFRIFQLIYNYATRQLQLKGVFAYIHDIVRQ
jgi:glycopeptide antibiotics resistance protein